MNQPSSTGDSALTTTRHKARDAERPADELARHLTDAMRSYTDALDLLPDTAVHDRGVIHNELGTIWANAGDIDRALHHFQQDIRYCEQAGDLHGAGVTRRNSARVLAAAGRLDDARVYADAALANFREFGDRAADDIQHTEDLIAAIDQAEAQAGADERRSVR